MFDERLMCLNLHVQQHAIYRTDARLDFVFLPSIIFDIPILQNRIHVQEKAGYVLFVAFGFDYGLGAASTGL